MYSIARRCVKPKLRGDREARHGFGAGRPRGGGRWRTAGGDYIRKAAGRAGVAHKNLLEIEKRA